MPDQRSGRFFQLHTVMPQSKMTIKTHAFHHSLPKVHILGHWDHNNSNGDITRPATRGLYSSPFCSIYGLVGIQSRPCASISMHSIVLICPQLGCYVVDWYLTMLWVIKNCIYSRQIRLQDDHPFSLSFLIASQFLCSESSSLPVAASPWLRLRMGSRGLCVVLCLNTNAS